jgi:hypothetical protein
VSLWLEVQEVASEHSSVQRLLDEPNTTLALFAFQVHAWAGQGPGGILGALAITGVLSIDAD